MEKTMSITDELYDRIYEAAIWASQAAYNGDGSWSHQQYLVFEQLKSDLDELWSTRAS